MKCVQKDLKKCDYTIYMDMNITTLPKKGLKTRPYSMDMNKENHIVTLPKKGLKTRPYNVGMEKRDLKTRPYNIDMEKKDLKKLTKEQLIKLLMNQGKKPIPRKNVNEDMILPPPEQFRDKQKKQRPPKPTRKPPLPPSPKDPFNFDNDIFQTENTSIGKFEIVSVQSRQNKKFKSYTNEFKVKILRKLDDIKEIYHIFQELVRTVKRRRKLSDNNMLRLVIQNEELPNAISTKFNKVQDFKLGNLENVTNILEYRAILIEKCKIVVQSVKIPAGKGRLYLTKDTVSRKNCIITIKNDDTICLARAVVTAYANLHPERWSKIQLKNGLNSSRKLQRDQAMKLHEEANIEINDYGNDLSNIETFAKHLGIEINIINAEQFNSIIYTANKGSEDKIYLLR